VATQFEAMAMGCPVISTSIGIEGPEARENIDFLQMDDSTSMGKQSGEYGDRSLM
jgi:glycosyltransferase involved in cell wall biosynthesis